VTPNPHPIASVVIVSFNTRNVLRECLAALKTELIGLSAEVFIVDNNSDDGSADMATAEFPEFQVLRSASNLGFAAANNLAFPRCAGKYIVLLNSDAFLPQGGLRRAISHMDSHARAAMGGARLVGRDGSWQPSARKFPSLLNEFFSLSGLSVKFAKSRLFGRQDRTWADQDQPTQTDWVPGAFAIIRKDVLEQVGYFDESFFLYHEEVDLCRRIKLAGFEIWYWPDIVVVHLGGESSKTIRSISLSEAGAQLTLWRMRSELMYYRKHLGYSAWLVMMLELTWHRIRAWKNTLTQGATFALKGNESRKTVRLMKQAWIETNGGRLSPPRPW
jgi:GT2 family glycosyltransferase